MNNSNERTGRIILCVAGGLSREHFSYRFTEISFINNVFDVIRRRATPFDSLQSRLTYVSTIKVRTGKTTAFGRDEKRATFDMTQHRIRGTFEKGSRAGT